MCKYSLISLALLSFSMVSNAAAVPMDADQAVRDAIQDVVLHREVVFVQGGGSDKDVADVSAVVIRDSCRDDSACNNLAMPSGAAAAPHIFAQQSLGDWFVQGDSGGRQPLMTWLAILVFVAFLLSRNSISTK